MVSTVGGLVRTSGKGGIILRYVAPPVVPAGGGPYGGWRAFPPYGGAGPGGNGSGGPGGSGSGDSSGGAAGDGEAHTPRFVLPRLAAAAAQAEPAYTAPRLQAHGA